MTEKKSIGLSEFIFQVKKDLLEKQLTEKDPAPLFIIEEVEVELSVVASREGGGTGGIELSVIGFGGGKLELGGKLNRENAQIVRVKLTPLLNKEQFLAQMDDDTRQRVVEQAQKTIARGEDGSSHPDDA